MLGERTTSSIRSVGKDWIFPCERMRLYSYFTTYAKLSSKGNKGKNVRPKTAPKRQRGNTSLTLALEMNFWMIPKSQEIKTKLNRGNKLNYKSVQQRK